MKENEKKVKKQTMASRFSKFKNQNLLEFIKKYSENFSFNEKGKIKLTSSDYFSNAVTNLSNKLKDVDTPVVIGQVGGFFETATLAGLLSNKCKSRTKPKLLFFDKNPNNIQNAIFNTLLIQGCSSIQEYLTSIFGLEYIDIFKAFSPKEYERVYSDIFKENDKLEEEQIEEKIIKEYLNKEIIDNILLFNFSLGKLQEYVSNKKYNKEAHLNLLLKKVKDSLSEEMYSTFEIVANNICNYFSKNNNFSDHLTYLLDDIKRNKETHLLNNITVFDGYKRLITKEGKGNIKFIPNIDITQKEGLLKLEQILTNENFISKDLDKNKFPVDISVIPHIRRFKEAYPFLKNTSEYFIEANRNHNSKDDSGIYSFQRTSTLFDPNYGNIEEKFENKLNESQLTNLKPMEKLDGYNFMTTAGINIGNRYTSYSDLKRIIDMAKVDKVDTIFIQSLIYSEHKRNQTKRRNITDNRYPDLDSRLIAGKKIIDHLTSSGLKVVYQMGDEDENLREELFYTYFHQELNKTNNFLAREDTDEKHDWIKNIIYEDLIPYLIRCGKDITVYYDDKGNKKTRIGDICSYISAIKYGMPLGDLQKLVDENGKPLIDEKYFKNNEMFQIINEKVVGFDENNSRVSVDVIANPNFSSETQYANPDAGVLKRIKDIQSGSIKNHSNSQILLDSRQGYMGANVIGGRNAQMALNTPQLTEDALYLEKEILDGRKRVRSDASYKRVTQPQNRMNFPGAWEVTGDLDWIIRLTPYFRRSREVMDYVQKTGQPLKKRVEMHITDIQTGSITERIAMGLKYYDMGLYKYNADVISYLGDLIQGWNYDAFGRESRHTAAQSVGQQMVDFQKLEKPFLKTIFGVVPPKAFVTKEDGLIVDEELSNLITQYLYETNLVEKKCGNFGYVYSIKKDIDYKNIPIPEQLKPYESHIKKRLNTIKLILEILMVHGNHEENSDKLQKGYKPLESFKTQLQDFKNFSASDVDIKYAEFIINSEGDPVDGSYIFDQINGYNTLASHNFRTPSKGNGGSACRSMANWLESIGLEYKDIDIVKQGHLHNFEAAVLNEKLYIVIPGMAGQSGFEQKLGYCSHPRGLIITYWEDGRISIDLINSNCLDNWEIMNPEIREIGLENHIKNCLTQQAPIISSEMPNQIYQPNQRILVPAELTRKIGPSIPR